MEYLVECAKILCNQCAVPSVKRKQKMLAKTLKKILPLIETSKIYEELINFIEEFTDLHSNYPEEPGNVLVSMVHLDKFPNLGIDIISESQYILEPERIDSFLNFINDKIRSQEVISRVDEITTELVKLKTSNSDYKIIENFETLIQKEYINILKNKGEDSDSEIEISHDSDDKKLKEIIHEMSILSKKRTRMPSGLKSLDRYLDSGFESTRIYVFGGKPGLGKSTLVLNCFLNGIKIQNSKNSKKQEVLVYITLENDKLETLERILRITTLQEISLAKINSDVETENIVNIIKNTYNKTMIVKYMIPYTTSTMDIFLYLDRISEEYDIKGVYVDYLNLIASAERNKKLEKRFELGMVTAELKVIAKRFQCPVVTPAQLNTGGYDGIPTMKNLDESRQIAQNADFIGLMFQYPIDKLPPQMVYMYPEDKYAIIGINIDKNRSGPTGLCFLLGQKNIFTFTDISDNINVEKNLRNKLLYGDKISNNNQQNQSNINYNKKYNNHNNNKQFFGVQNQNYNSNMTRNDKFINTPYD